MAFRPLVVQPVARAFAGGRDWLLGEIGRGSAVNLGFAVVNSAMALLTAIFAGNALGPEGVGILTLGFLVLEFAGMLDNLGTYGFLRDYAAAPDPAKLATALRLKIFLGIGTTLLILATAPLLAPALDMPVELLLLFSLVPTLAIASGLATAVHEARRAPWRRNTAITFEGLVKTLLYAALLVALGTGSSVLDFAYATIAASLVGAVVGLFLLPSMRISPWDAARAGRYLHFGVGMQAGQAMNKVIFWVDILLLDLLLGHYVQGLYRTAYAVMAFVPLFAQTVGVFLFPAVAEATHRGEHDRARHLFRHSFGYVLAIAAPLVLGILLFAPWILGIFGAEFAQAADVARWLALIALLPVLLVPFEALFPALDKPWLNVRIAAAMAAVNVVLDLLLIPRWGMSGALLATAVAYLLGVGLAAWHADRLGMLRRQEVAA